MSQKSTNVALVASGLGLYVLSSIVEHKAEEARPSPPDQPRLKSHPVASLATVAGAALAVIGLARIKPSYGAAGFGAYVLVETLVFPPPKPRITKVGQLR